MKLLAHYRCPECFTKKGLGGYLLVIAGEYPKPDEVSHEPKCQCGRVMKWVTEAEILRDTRLA